MFIKKLNRAQVLYEITATRLESGLIADVNTKAQHNQRMGHFIYGIWDGISSYIKRIMNQIRIALTLLLSICGLISSAQHLSQKELVQISEKIKSYPIIGLGEAQHFYKGYYDTKYELVKHLIKEESINLIALEASIHVTSILNSYINGRAALNLSSTLIALNEPYSLQKAGLYNCPEIANMINWLKEYNAKQEKKIQLVGIDFQNYSLPLNQLKNYASSVQKDQISNTKILLDSSMNAILDSNIMIITSPTWLERMEKAKKNIKSLKSTIGNDKNKLLFHELEQFTSLWDDPTFPRDSMMYENLNRYIDKKSGILIWAASFHLENDPQFKGPKKLGVFLKEKYAEKYFVIGVADQTKENKNTIISPVNEKAPNKYDLIINIDKGDKCEQLAL